MSEPRLQLKRASGWFAAGAEVLRAATVLSDSAFKVFVCISLHAERNSGRLRIDVSALARSVAKTEGEVRGRMDELVQAGVCRFNAGFIEIQDPYWPYHRTPVRSAVDDSEAFVASVRRLFLSYACVSSTFSPADERLASEWCCRGISFEQVERAVHLGVARKYVALINHGTGTPITTLHYFQRLIDEVEESGASPDYWRHIAARTAEFERRWRALRASQSIGSGETK